MTLEDILMLLAGANEASNKKREIPPTPDHALKKGNAFLVRLMACTEIHQVIPIADELDAWHREVTGTEDNGTHCYVHAFMDSFPAIIAVKFGVDTTHKFIHEMAVAPEYPHTVN